MARTIRKVSHNALAVALFERLLHGLFRGGHMCGRGKKMKGEGSEEGVAGAGGVVAVVGGVVAAAGMVVVLWWWWPWRAGMKG